MLFFHQDHEGIQRYPKNRLSQAILIITLLLKYMFTKQFVHMSDDILKHSTIIAFLYPLDNYLRHSAYIQLETILTLSVRSKDNFYI